MHRIAAVVLANAVLGCCLGAGGEGPVAVPPPAASAPAPAPPVAAAAPPIEGPSAALPSGSGSGGAGGLHNSTLEVPSVRMTTPTVVGALPAEIVRRVARRHLGEIRSCYERELGVTPTLEGQLELSWTIAATGAVESATVGPTTFVSPALGTCMTQAVERWVFPAPEEAGVVRVALPVVLELGE